MSENKIESATKALSPLKGRDISGHEVNLYSFEAVQDSLKNYLALPQVVTEESDPWLGFFEKDGVHYGAIRTIAKRLNVSTRKIHPTITVLNHLKGRNMGGAETSLYSFEAVQAQFRGQ